MLEIGARNISGESEDFHSIVDHFPGSKVVGFEVDDYLCSKMNAESDSGFNYYAQAIGGANEEADFYETLHPMCGSLLEPNLELVEKYNAMEVMRLQTVSSLHTMTLDDFIASKDIGPIDFIKIDVQGAELDIFKASPETFLSIHCSYEQNINTFYGNS